MALDGREMMKAMEQVSIRRRDRLKRHYTTVSNVIIFGYRELSDSEKLTYAAIDSFDWSDGEGLRKGYAFPSVETLATLRAADRRTIFRHFTALESVGLLTREQRPGRPTLLWIEDPSEEESARYLSTITPGRDTDVTPTHDTNVTPNKKEEPETDKTVNGEQSSWKGKGPRLPAEERAKREWLAQEILKVCGDVHSLGFYRKVAATVPEHHIFAGLSELRQAIRETRIRTNRGAFFSALTHASRGGSP
jgi:hypothetical protein